MKSLIEAATHVLVGSDFEVIAEQANMFEKTTGYVECCMHQAKSKMEPK